MGDIISLTEAVRRYRIGEKTLRKWLKRANLVKIEPNESKVKQWQIDTDDLERLIREKSIGTTPGVVTPVVQDTLSVQLPDREQITELASELSYQQEIIEALKGELEALRDRVALLEQGTRKRPARRAVADVAGASYSVKSQAAEDTKRDQTPREPTSTRPLLPEGWSSWTPFIERHGISSERRPLVKAIKREEYCAEREYMQMSAKGGQVVKCALSPDGMSRLLTAIKTLPIGGELTQCEVEDCPCHGLLLGQETLWTEEPN